MIPAPLRLVALCGSLRAHSSNGELLRAMQLVAPAHVHVTIHDGVGKLPLFNPDLDTGDPLCPMPDVATRFRADIEGADGLVVSSPEYAHGIPGAMKNALDWLVGAPAFAGKRVALLTPSSRATYAHAQLVEVLTTMSAELVFAQVIPVDDRTRDAASIAADPALRGVLLEMLGRFA